jgi:Domain of Unknown Function (DUF1080)
LAFGPKLTASRRYSIQQDTTAACSCASRPRAGGKSAAIIALGTIETTRLALTTFQQSLGVARSSEWEESRRPPALEPDNPHTKNGNRGQPAAGDRIWHLNTNEPTVQNYTPGPPLIPGVWFEYEIVAQGDDYTVFLTNTQAGERKQTTSFHNTDAERGRSPGFIGVQAYSGNSVAWRHIRIST